MYIPNGNGTGNRKFHFVFGGLGVLIRSTAQNLATCLVFWALSWSMAVHGQVPDPKDQPTLPAKAVSRLITLGPGDSVNIQVYGQADMTTTVDVSDDGSVRVPLVGQVAVGGLSPSEASLRIEAALKQGKFLVDPHVTVTVVLSRSQRVSVSGQVGKPGVYPIESNTTIFDLLAQAGGSLETGSDEVYLLRADASGTVQRYTINLRGLDDATRSIPNQKLQGGDSIFVPRTAQFYIYGEVTQPNKYKIEPGMTVVQAISRAGGITVRGSEHRVDIKRLTENGTYKTFSAKLNELVKPDDVIHVKESIF
jgi:polysaccharide biosynthesis/export protein